jgi:hypothetical protein
MREAAIEMYWFRILGKRKICFLKQGKSFAFYIYLYGRRKQDVPKANEVMHSID